VGFKTVVRGALRVGIGILVEDPVPLLATAASRRSIAEEVLFDAGLRFCELDEGISSAFLDGLDGIVDAGAFPVD
jgi:hypothetical protein